MDLQANSEEKKSIEIEIIVEKCLKKHGEGLESSKEVVSKLTDITLSYISLLIHESSQISDLKNTKTISGDDVKTALDTINRRTNLMTDSEYDKVINLLPNLKTHKLNNDECKLISICFHKWRSTNECFSFANKTSYVSWKAKP